MSRTSARHRHGFFLVLVLVVVAVATMAVYSFTELMLAADETAYLQGDLVQARLNVDTGVETVRLVLASPPADRDEMGGVYENASLFRSIAITNELDGPVQRFSVIAPGISDTGSLGGIRFGLQDESARINVNALLVLEENSDAIGMLTTLSGGSAAADGILGDAISGGSGATSGSDETLDAENIAVELLLTLPGMDEAIADAILDWIDEDSEPRAMGCEDEYYSSLSTPYACPNEPLKSVEELLLVRGVTPQLLFGADTNRNGVLDLDEQQRTAASIDTSGALGWAAYLTVHGGENNKTAAGDPRVNINGEDLEVLYDELLTALGDETFASFIVAYRMYGKSSIENSTALLAANALSGGDEVSDEADSASESEKELWSVDVMEDVDLTAGPAVEINQVLDLIDAEVTIGDGEEAVVYMSPFISDPTLMSEYLPLLMDQLSTQDVDVLPGRINLNEAPAEILAGISLVDADTMAAILEARNASGAGAGAYGSGSATDRTHETWPLTEGIVSLDQMRALMPLVTAGGDVFRAQVIGFDETTGLAARGEAIIDATTVNPRVVAYRDLTHLGRGFEISVLRGY
ncbi:type II secretion system minor pseudopilin [Rhodopirellula sallentina]|uniref:Type II secretory pathway component PulK-like protein n=1 Tax=Rhodopirellula sallentina SM41 TaxID=1263870 RepID=M5TXD3_9BACT|nr:type II secretion system protein GspK [Rhodopirellula sallentina]EMI53887.1 type II secretory pathway component PulK-like protein [Rhodopirellula sallentina SM41]